MRLGPQQVQNAALAIVAMLILFVIFTFTQTGRAMRATADNAGLAAVKGIDTEKITRLVSFLGMGLAGAAGVLLGADTSIEPLLGLKVILSVFAAAVLGGLGSIPGAVLGAFAIGIVEEASQIVVPATYKGAVGFVAILLVLSFRPSGLLGRAPSLDGGPHMDSYLIAMVTLRRHLRDDGDQPQSRPGAWPAWSIWGSPVSSASAPTRRAC